jgi:hypothetical protein
LIYNGNGNGKPQSKETETQNKETKNLVQSSFTILVIGVSLDRSWS